MCTKTIHVRVEEMKKEILRHLQEKYGTNLVGVKEKSLEDIEANNFLIKEHAEAIEYICQRSKYMISFREAGRYTLQRIKEGNPCKGHTIMDKSIKLNEGDNKSKCKYTYDISDEKFDLYHGLIGVPGTEEQEDRKPELKGLWKVDNNTPKVVAPPIQFNNQEKSDNYYTGDYDMHDLFAYKNDKYNRIIANTPDESSAIDYFNLAMIDKGESENRKKIVDSFRKANPNKRIKDCEYSLIRHGAQTSFMCYLHGITGCKELKKEIEIQGDSCNKILWEDSVMNISERICVFDIDGKAYILNGLKEIYSFYNQRNMLDRIPFYYFFKSLREEEKYKKMLEKYSDSIFYYLKTCYS